MSTLVQKESHQNIVAAYLEERKERFYVLEINRKYMEKIIKGESNNSDCNQQMNFVADISKVELGNLSLPQLVFRFQKVQDEKNEIVECRDEADSLNIEEEYEENDEWNFSRWLRSISHCLSSKICDDSITVSPEVEEKNEEDEDSNRYLKIVQSVFDEETATRLVKSYLKHLKVGDTACSSILYCAIICKYVISIFIYRFTFFF